MKYILNSREMKQCDSRTIEHYGLPSMVLMERAALSVVSFLHERDLWQKKIVILCGSGSNGGDGLAIARLLYLEGGQVSVCLVGDFSKASPENMAQQKICRQYGMELSSSTDTLADAQVIVDALFGIGLSRELGGDYPALLQEVNAMDAYRLAVDIPSGVSADDGQIMGQAFLADATITFAFAKVGQMLYPGKRYCGELIVSAIGIESCSLADQVLPCKSLEKEDLKQLPQASPDDHKGSRGKVLVIAGSEDMAGAAYLASKSALTSGAGMVKVYTPRCNRDIILTRFPEAILVTYDKWNEKQLLEELAWADAIAIGPGLGKSNLAENLVRTTLENAAVPMVVDADALGILAEHLQWLKKPHTETVITPHLGEMARLMGSPLMYVTDHKLSIAQDFARDYQVICALKDAATIVSVPYATTYINASGCSGMATAGSGDVLTGVIAGLIAQGLRPEDAASLGVYLHGLAGEEAARTEANLCMQAGDIIKGIKTIYQKEGR